LNIRHGNIVIIRVQSRPGDAMTDQITNAIIPLAACRPHPANYNRHDDAQIADLRNSLRAFGQVRSIVVQAEDPSLRGGPQPDEAIPSYLIVAGHGLIEAARLEGLPTLRADIIPAASPTATPLQSNTPGQPPPETIL
jgi:hypothetical protein